MTEDERMAQEYLTKLQESVGRGEINLAEYDRLADLALSNIPATSQVARWIWPSNPSSSCGLSPSPLTWQYGWGYALPLVKFTISGPCG